ncbi:MAG: hypothetical protein K8S94_09200 [Planctomycetia bacterium]|nr:hypothetical protein [Planctomycetia bacterium]
MSREPLEFRGESLLGQLDSTLESLTDSGLLLLEYFGVHGHEIIRRLNRDHAPFHIEQAVERAGIVAGVEERAESAFCFTLDRVVLAGKFSGRFLKTLAVRLHGGREQPERVLRKKPNASLRKRQRDRAPVRRGFRANGSNGTVGGMFEVEDEFAGREKFPVGMKRSGCRSSLLRGESLTDAQPREGEFHGGHGGAEPLGGVGGGLGDGRIGGLSCGPARCALAGCGLGGGCCGHVIPAG